MDIYLFQSILNIIWTLFSILFVLYRFTSFFSYIYNSLKFIGRIIMYIKNKLTNRSEYIVSDQRNQSEPFFTRFKKGVYYIMGYTDTPNTPNIPDKTGPLFDSNLHASHDTTWLNGDPNQISYSALHNSDDIDLMTMDPFAETPRGSSNYQEFRSVNFV